MIELTKLLPLGVVQQFLDWTQHLDLSLIKGMDKVCAGLALVSTFLFSRASYYAWPVTMIVVLLNILLFCAKGIHGNLGLSFYYLAATCYGWWKWSPSKTREELPVQSLNLKSYGLVILGWLLCFGIIYKVLIMTGSQKSTAMLIFDGLSVSIAIVAQLLTCHKLIQCWHFWFIRDIIVMPLYFYSGLPFKAGVHIIYLVLAVSGYMKWRQLQAKAPAPLSKTQVSAA